MAAAVTVFFVTLPAITIRRIISPRLHNFTQVPIDWDLVKFNQLIGHQSSSISGLNMAPRKRTVTTPDGNTDDDSDTQPTQAVPTGLGASLETIVSLDVILISKSSNVLLIQRFRTRSGQSAPRFGKVSRGTSTRTCRTARRASTSTTRLRKPSGTSRAPCPSFTGLYIFGRPPAGRYASLSRVAPASVWGRT